MMDAHFNEEKYLLSRQIREANKGNLATLNQEYLNSINYKRNGVIPSNVIIVRSFLITS
jgi:hypothetical protein